MKRAKNILKIMSILPVILFLLSCNNILKNEAKSNSILILTQLTGVTADGKTANYLQSDVVIVDPATLEKTYKEDVAKATLEARLKEPVTVGIGASYQNSILVNRYRVTYEAVDPSDYSPPQSIEGSFSTLIEIGSSAEISFIIVREVAKKNSPLSDLVAAGANFQVLATVTFYGRDLAKDVEITATGTLSIFFSNYEDD